MIQQYWKYAILVILLPVSFFWGRQSGPTKIVEIEKKVEVIKEAQIIQQKIDIQELIKQVQDIVQKQAKNVRREVTVTKAPDGSETKHVVETDQSTSESSAHTENSKNTNTTTTTDTKIWKETIRIEEKLKIVERPMVFKWMIGLDIGYHIPSLWGDQLNFNLIPVRGLVGGVSVQRKLFGPVWGGPWINSAGMAGVNIKLVW